MAKVSLNKLITVKVGETKTVTINGNEIVVKQYLPLAEKIQVIENVLNNAIDDLTDFSFVKLQTFIVTEIVKAYTNISFTETQEKDIPKLYDLLVLNNIWQELKKEIPESEYDFIEEMVYKESNRISTYFHSMAGVLNAVKQDYDATNMNVDGLIDKIKNDESIGLIRDIMAKEVKTDE